MHIYDPSSMHVAGWTLLPATNVLVFKNCKADLDPPNCAKKLCINFQPI